MNSSTVLAAFVAHCRKLTRRKETPDAELLRRFLEQRENAAFEELLERYAPLVWGVCRRIVSREADCEDAFQAVFLTLFHKGGAVDPERPLGAWLHGVAVHAAHKAAARSARQPTLAALPEQATRGDIADELGNRELFRVVDEEIARLPALLREPFVLCCLEGRTRDEAAAALHCSVAAIKSRLERSRNLLRQRLERRGFGLPAAFLVLGLTRGQVQASLRAKALQCVLGSVPSAIAALVPAAGVSLASKLTLTALALVVVGVLGFGAFRVMDAEPPEEAAATAKDIPPPSPSSDTPQPRLDRYGDLLPPGAIRRFGTQRFRHPGIVEMAFTPDGKRLIAGAGRHPLAVFDTVTGRRFADVGKVSSFGNLHGFALSPDGQRVACCGSDVFVWDLDTGRLVREWKCGPSQSVAFSPDGKKIAAVKEREKKVVLVEVATGKHLGEWAVEEGKGRQFDFGSLAFSPDGKYLAGILSERREKKTGPHSFSSYLVSSQVCVLDAATGKLVRAFESAVSFLPAFAFQPGTGRLAVAGKDRVLRLWDVETGKELHRLPARKGMNYVPRFTADGRRCLALDNKAGALALLDARDGRELRLLKCDANLLPTVIALSPDGRAVAAAKYFGGVRVHVWDIESGTERLADAGHDWSPNLSLSADGRMLISQSERVFHWDLRTGEGRPQPPAVKKEDDRISWEFGKPIARGRNWRLRIDDENREIEVRSLDGSRLLRKINAPLGRPSLALSPDAAYVAIAFDDARNTAFLWDPEKEEKPRTLEGHPDACRHLLFSHDGRRLIAGGEPRNNSSSPTVWIWDVGTAQCLHKLATNSAPGDMLLTADDRVLLSAGQWNDATVHAWDMETGKELACLVDPSLKHPREERAGGYPPEISGLALSPDERFLAVFSRWGDNSAVSVWETDIWKLVRAFAPTQLRYYDNSIFSRSMTFSRAGRLLFVAYLDGTILEWDVSGRLANGPRQPAGEKANRDGLNDLWRQLTETPDKAWLAVWEMLDQPAESVRFLIDKLSPVKQVEEKRVRRLLAQLDSESFSEREEANRQLSAMGEQIKPMLREALKDRLPLETRKRIEGVMESLNGIPAPESLRLLRAVAVLEWSNRPEAVEHLRKLADGASSASLTRAAKAALQRRPEKSLGRSPPVKEK